jgi:hypothetical protein
MFDEGVNYPIGKFYMTQKHMRVTDPCYNAGTQCTHIIMNALPGIWEAFTNFKNTLGWRNAELIVIHRDHINEMLGWEHPWTLIATADIGVDSGQAGFFDAALYPRDETGEPDDKNSFYGHCRRLTCEQMNENFTARNPSFMNAGCLESGAVSSSGYGDGSYNLYVFEDHGHVVGAKLVFLPEEDEEEEDIPEDEEDEDEDAA